jgi:hypothetical protein
LIEAIVRQTTVLIARLSTAAGARSPLGHIADQIFSGIVKELSHQGVSNKVIADMFGLALRSYRQKVQRLAGPAAPRGTTLRSSVLAFLAEREWSTREEVLARFKYGDDVSVRSILRDLVESGAAIRSGMGDGARYRAATEDELCDLGTRTSSGDPDLLTALVWLQIYREGPLTLDQLAQRLPFSRSELGVAVGTLTVDGRVARQAQGTRDVFTAKPVSRPIAEVAGWEAALVDHHGSVLNAIAAQVTSGSRSSAPTDEVGETTLTFDLWPGHPKEMEVRQLLAQARAAALTLWEDVNAARKNQARAGAYRIHFYLGQYVVAEDDLPRVASSSCPADTAESMDAG